MGLKFSPPILVTFQPTWIQTGKLKVRAKFQPILFHQPLQGGLTGAKSGPVGQKTHITRPIPMHGCAWVLIRDKWVMVRYMANLQSLDPNSPWASPMDPKRANSCAPHGGGTYRLLLVKPDRTLMLAGSRGIHRQRECEKLLGGNIFLSLYQACKDAHAL